MIVDREERQELTKMMQRMSVRIEGHIFAIVGGDIDNEIYALKKLAACINDWVRVKEGVKKSNTNNALT